MNRWDWLGLFDIYMMIFWCVTYIECIRIGIKEKTYCMPLLALCMNFCWEALSLVDYCLCGGENASTYVLYGAWTILDIGIVVTYIVYGKQELLRDLKRLKNRKIDGVQFVIYSLGVFFLILAIILTMYYTMDNWKMYFVFPNNVIMSILFIVMYYIRGGKRGQSVSIAIAKCIGTLCATITMILAGQLFGVVLGGICLLLDIAYIVILAQHPKYCPMAEAS